jgi:hypothetical protein
LPLGHSSSGLRLTRRLALARRIRAEQPAEYIVDWPNGQAAGTWLRRRVDWVGAGELPS